MSSSMCFSFSGALRSHQHTGAAGPAAGSLPRVLLVLWMLSWALHLTKALAGHWSGGGKTGQSAWHAAGLPSSRVLHCQRQKCSNTLPESTHKYEQPECLRWVS